MLLLSACPIAAPAALLQLRSSASSPPPRKTTPPSPSTSSPSSLPSPTFTYARASTALRWHQQQFRETSTVRVGEEEELEDGNFNEPSPLPNHLDARTSGLPTKQQQQRFLFESVESNASAPREQCQLFEAIVRKALPSSTAVNTSVKADAAPSVNPYLAANAKLKSVRAGGKGSEETSSCRKPVTRSGISRKLSKLALKKAKDWKERVERLSEAICKLDVNDSVADLLSEWKEQLAPTDMSHVVKRVGNTHWHRALELYEWLNLRQWYTPNFRTLATILGVLGRANEVTLAEEIYERAQPVLQDCVQVYNAMMSVYARHGDWDKVQHILGVMSSRGCDADLFTFNIIINARSKLGLQPGMAMSFLQEIINAGLTPDVVTYNTLISACTSQTMCSEAAKVFKEMKLSGCEPDVWTYNAMISVFGRSGADESAREIFETMQLKGLEPDSVTYNAILHAYARSGRVDHVERVRIQMESAGCRADEITYNTTINMYGKLGLYEKAFSIYQEMKDAGCHPDAVTFTVLIDTLGKAELVKQAETVFAEMEQAEVRPTLQAFSAMIGAYAKAGRFTQAEQIYACMLRTGIAPDGLAYSLMLEVFQNADLPTKAMDVYQRMVKDGFKPGLNTYKSLLCMFIRKGMLQEIEVLSSDLQHSSFEHAEVYNILLKAGLLDKAFEFLKVVAMDGFIPSYHISWDALNAYRESGRWSEAHSFVVTLANFAPQVGIPIRQSFVSMLVRAKQLDAAKEEINELLSRGQIPNVNICRELLVAFEQADLYDEALRLFSDMQCLGVQPDAQCYKIALAACCRLGFLDSAHDLLRGNTLLAKSKEAFDVYVALIEFYGKQGFWENAEMSFKELQQGGHSASTRAWNALISAYATCGQHEVAKLTLYEMVKAGQVPTSMTCNAILEAFVNAGQLQDVHSLLLEMRQLGASPSKSTFLVALDASIKKGSVSEAKRVFQELKGAGYLPNVKVYQSLILLLCNEGLVQDSEFMLKEMESDNFAPDIVIYNAMLNLYGKAGHYRKAVEFFQGMQVVGCKPDSDTFNNMMRLYGRHSKVPEALALLRQMQKEGYAPNVESFTALISACGRLQLVEAAKIIFKEMQETGCKPNVSVFNAMMKVYRGAGQHEQAKQILNLMKDAGIEPTLGTFHVFMDSYGKGGKPEEAEAVLQNMQEAGFTLGALQYTSLINAYLKNRDYDTGIKRLLKMRADGFEPDFKTWTSVVGAASLCEKSSEALKLLFALHNVGFSLPLRLLTERTDRLLVEVEDILEALQTFGLDAVLGFVNVLVDLLWGFQRRATAAKIFGLAVRKNIYSQDMARVQCNDWKADFRRLSAGGALVALTLWLDQMQDAALQGFPESSKFVLLVTGSNCNSSRVSVNKTLKAHLWAMGSPFLPSITRTGVLIAKGHSLRMWLKDSPHCADLELKDVSILPKINSMQIHSGALMQVELIPALKQIEEGLGDLRPKKFSRLIHMSDSKRVDVIQADLLGKKEMLEKGKVRLRRSKKIMFKKRRQKV